jgi:protein TonB
MPGDPNFVPRLLLALPGGRQKVLRASAWRRRLGPMLGLSLALHVAAALLLIAFRPKPPPEPADTSLPGVTMLFEPVGTPKGTSPTPQQAVPAELAPPPEPVPPAPTPPAPAASAPAPPEPAPPAPTPPAPAASAPAPPEPAPPAPAPPAPAASAPVPPEPAPPAPSVRLPELALAEPPLLPALRAPQPEAVPAWERPPPMPAPAPAPAPRAARPAGTFSAPQNFGFGPAVPLRRNGGSSGAIDFSLGPGVLNSRGEPPRGGNRLGSVVVRGAQVGPDWIQLLDEWWAEHRYYPPQAAARGEDGIVKVHVSMDRDGTVRGVELETYSGSQWLDMGALALFRNAHLPPFPPGTPEEHADLDITIDYILIR